MNNILRQNKFNDYNASTPSKTDKQRSKVREFNAASTTYTQSPKQELSLGLQYKGVITHATCLKPFQKPLDRLAADINDFRLTLSLSLENYEISCGSMCTLQFSSSSLYIYVHVYGQEAFCMNLYEDLVCYISYRNFHKRGLVFHRIRCGSPKALCVVYFLSFTVVKLISYSFFIVYT